MGKFDRSARIALERTVPGKQFKEDNTKRIKIAARVATFAFYLFRTHVIDRAEALRGSGKGARDISGFGNTEVENHNPAVLIEVEI